jgi:hypothetical protein
VRKGAEEGCGERVLEVGDRVDGGGPGGIAGVKY